MVLPTYDSSLSRDPYVYHGGNDGKLGQYGLDVSTSSYHGDGYGGLDSRFVSEEEFKYEISGYENETDRRCSIFSADGYRRALAAVNRIEGAREWLDSFVQRLDALVPANSLVSKSALHRWLNGRINPEIDQDDSKGRYGYSQSEQGFLLGIAEGNRAAIESLSGMSQPLWISGAGGPGAGKSTALIRFVADKFGADMSGLAPQDWREAGLVKVLKSVFTQSPAVWAGADRSGLLDITEAKGHPGTCDEDSYKYWRWASNFLANLALSRAVDGNKNVVHDTTLSGFSNLPEARKRGYYTIAVPVAAPLEMREQATEQRNAVYFQSLKPNVTAQDAAFGEKLPQIIADSDEVHLHWRDDANSEARLVAMVMDNAKIAVYDEAAFEKLCALYPKMQAKMADLTRDDSLVSRIPDMVQNQRIENETAARPGAPFAPNASSRAPQVA